MKKNILGMVAVVIALAASAFTVPAKVIAKTTDPYWFSISNVAKDTPVPQAKATFIQQSASAPVETCTTGSAHQCVSGFDVSQVNTSTNQLNGTQMPQSQPQLKL